MALELRIATPCTEKWESMAGDDRVRFCAGCERKVFNIEKLTEAQVRQLFIETNGRVCGRIYQRTDGTVLTKDCPVGVATFRRRVLAAISVAVTMCFMVLGFRATAKKCPDPAGNWFDRVVTNRALEARETLRETNTFGPLINEVWPVEVTITMPDRVLGGMMPRKSKP